jgi:hypothetical protein
MSAESDGKFNSWIAGCLPLYIFFFTEKQREGERNAAEKDKGISRYMYKTKLRGLSPRVNYTDRAAAAGQQS